MADKSDNLSETPKQKSITFSLKNIKVPEREDSNEEKVIIRPLTPPPQRVNPKLLLKRKISDKLDSAKRESI